MEDELKKLRAKIIAASRDFNRIEKAGENTHHHYHFVGAEQMLQQINRLLPAHGLVASLVSDSFRNDNGQTIYQATYKIEDADTLASQVFTVEELVGNVKGRDAGKSGSVAKTTALNYFYRNLFQVAKVDKGAEINEGYSSSIDPADIKRRVKRIHANYPDIREWIQGVLFNGAAWNNLTLDQQYDFVVGAEVLAAAVDRGFVVTRARAEENEEEDTPW